MLRNQFNTFTIQRNLVRVFLIVVLFGLSTSLSADDDMKKEDDFANHVLTPKIDELTKLRNEKQSDLADLRLERIAGRSVSSPDANCRSGALTRCRPELIYEGYEGTIEYMQLEAEIQAIDDEIRRLRKARKGEVIDDLDGQKPKQGMTSGLPGLPARPEKWSPPSNAVPDQAK